MSNLRCTSIRCSVITAVLFSLALAACSGTRGNGTLIGATCVHSSECGPAGLCVTSGPDGLCTMACQVSGGPQECPLGSYCDHQSVKLDTGVKTDMLLCFPACVSSLDCRVGYECNGVSSGPGKVCQPK